MSERNEDQSNFWIPVMRMSIYLVLGLAILVGIVLFSTWLDR